MNAPLAALLPCSSASLEFLPRPASIREQLGRGAEPASTPQSLLFQRPAKGGRVLGIAALQDDGTADALLQHEGDRAITARPGAR